MRLFATWDRFRALFATLGWLMMLVIVYATLSTIERRPHVPTLSPDIERFAAYLALGLALGTGYPRRHALIVATGVIVIPSLEAAQLLSMTRHGDWHDCLIKLAGLASGIGLSGLFEHVVRRQRS